ncbi:MAG TPA: ATP-grasp fold amidoligase family protein [Dongiaceae bacterium]|nr:ATP-grasp fold amidoligase family protein [Dongiaceae bacterium]
MQMARSQPWSWRQRLLDALPQRAQLGEEWVIPTVWAGSHLPPRAERYCRTPWAGFSFVRVDLYAVDGRPLFGELTFFPDAGYAYLNPPAFDRRLGELRR